MPKFHLSGGKQYQWAFWGLLTLFTLIRLCYIQWGPLDLAPDEAHYWEWSRHLDISYYSKGPMVAFIIFLMTSLGEDSVFFIRLGAVLISAILSIVLYRLAKDMFKNEKIGFFAALLPQFTLLFSAGSILMTIDSPFLLFWGLTLSCFYRALRFNKFYWYPAGIFFGLGFLSKYSMVLFLPLALVFLFWQAKYRFWLKRKELRPRLKIRQEVSQDPVNRASHGQERGNSLEYRSTVQRQPRGTAQGEQNQREQPGLRPEARDSLRSDRNKRSF